MGSVVAVVGVDGAVNVTPRGIGVTNLDSNERGCWGGGWQQILDKVALGIHLGPAVRGALARGMKADVKVLLRTAHS